MPVTPITEPIALNPRTTKGGKKYLSATVPVWIHGICCWVNVFFANESKNSSAWLHVEETSPRATPEEQRQGMQLLSDKGFLPMLTVDNAERKIKRVAELTEEMHANLFEIEVKKLQIKIMTAEMSANDFKNYPSRIKEEAIKRVSGFLKKSQKDLIGNA